MIDDYEAIEELLIRTTIEFQAHIISDCLISIKISADHNK